MKIKSFNDLSKPLLRNWKAVNYDNCEHKTELNFTMSKKKLIVDYNDTVNSMFIEAFATYKNLSFIVFFGLTSNEVYTIYTKLLKKCMTIYGIKELKLNAKQMKLMNFNQKAGKISILIFKFKSLTSIKSKLTEFKHIMPETDRDKISLARSLFSNETLRFMNKCKNPNKLFKKSNRYFEKYRDFLFTNIDPSDHYKFMLFSSITLYLLGLREMNDLDVYVDNLNNSQTPDILNTIESDLKDKFDFVDVSIKGTQYWKHYWDRWLPEWARLCGTNQFTNIIIDPKFHFYWKGIKVIALDCDVKRRIHRNRPRAYGDLIMLKKEGILRYNHRIPTPVFKKSEFKLVENLTKEELKCYLNDDWFYKDGNKVEIQKDTDIDRYKFISTVKWWLDKMYDFKITTMDVKDILRIKDAVKPNNPILQEHIEFKRKMIKIKKIATST